MTKIGEPFHNRTALETLLTGEHEAQTALLGNMAKLVDLVMTRQSEIETTLKFLTGFVQGADLRMEALEKRLYHMEDKVREILQRLPGIERVVSPPLRASDSEQLPSDHHSEGGAVETSDGVFVSVDGGKAVKRNT